MSDVHCWSNIGQGAWLTSQKKCINIVTNSTVNRFFFFSCKVAKNCKTSSHADESLLIDASGNSSPWGSEAPLQLLQVARGLFLELAWCQAVESRPWQLLQLAGLGLLPVNTLQSARQILHGMKRRHNWSRHLRGRLTKARSHQASLE